MTLTTRPAGQLLAVTDGEPLAEVTAVVWSDGEIAGGLWGGILELPPGATDVRERLASALGPFRLRLADGREGLIELGLSEFEADGQRPLTFVGRGPLARP